MHTRAPAAVRFMRANNVYIILYCTTDGCRPIQRRIVRADLCFAAKQTQSDQAKRRTYSIRGGGGIRTRFNPIHRLPHGLFPMATVCNDPCTHHRTKRI